MQRTIDEHIFQKLLTLKMQESAIIAYGGEVAMNLLYNWGFTESKSNDLGKVFYVIVEPDRFLARLANYIEASWIVSGQSRNFKNSPEAFQSAVAKAASLQMAAFKTTDDTPYDSVIPDIHLYGQGSVKSSNKKGSANE
jgi:hypothetical protein